MQIWFKKLALSSLFLGVLPASAFAGPTRDVSILWHRVCSRFTQDDAVYMPHNKKAEGAIKIVIGPDARIVAPEAPNPFAMQVALYYAVHAPEAISIDVAAMEAEGRVIHPLVHQDSSHLQVDADKLAALEEKYKEIAVYVVNSKGMILGSSSYIPRGVRYDEDRIGPVSTPNQIQSQVLKKDGGFLVTLGFQSRRGVRDLSPVDLRLGALCDESVTPLLVSFSSQDPQFLPADKGVAFPLVPGQNLKISWPRENQEVAWIVRDLNENGIVDSGRELFGSETEISQGVFAANGFAALSVLDKNQNKILEENEMKELKLWFDKNADGKTGMGELEPLAKRVSEISLNARINTMTDAMGNKAPLISEAKDKKGTQIRVLDYLLKTLDLKK